MKGIISADTLTLQSFTELLHFFRTGTAGHAPSPAMLNGLFNLQNTYSKMLTGELDSRMFVSSLDPGVGKTSAIKAWLKVYLRNMRMYSDKGVILCFDRLEEIREFHKGNPLEPSVFGVFVSEGTTEGRELNSYGVGHQNISDAPILFTTKQQIIRKGRQHGSFEGIKLFHYRGAPRPVRSWDESAIVGRPLFTTRGKIQRLAGALELEDPEVYDLLDSWAYDLKHCKDKAVLEFPDVGGMDFLYSRKWEEQDKETAETLAMLSGKVVTVRAEGSGKIVLTCIESIPDDFFPFVVTDASARVRKTYSLLADYHDKVTYLDPVESVKKYDPLTVHVWERSSSKDYYKKHGIEETSKEIIRIVQTRPLEERFLIVTMKGEKESIRKQWEKAIRDGLQGGDRTRLEFLTWNRHTATNDYSDIPNVILTSLLNYKPYQYEVNGRAAAFLPSALGEFSEEQIQEFKNGEHAHHLLQCICRGAVRNARGEYSHEARCWIVTANKTVINELLPKVFPGCTVKAWETHSAIKENSPTHLRAIDFILSACETMTPDKVVSRLREHMGYRSSEKSNFRKTFLENTSFTDLCARSGIIIGKKDNGRWIMEKNPFL